MENLNIALLQGNLNWEDADRNLELFSKQMTTIDRATDLIVLPEMFNTGFTMNTVTLAEKMGGKTVQWMLQKSREKNCVLTGSLIIQEDGSYYNRLLWVRPDGTFEVYDKRHLFRMAAEDSYFRPGTRRLVVNLKGWKVCPMVCYDLRFPVWSRNRFSADYDLLIYVANWPERRIHAWKTLLMARAIENQAYVIGLNRVGNDGNSISYSGDSAVMNFKGEPIIKSDSAEEMVLFTEISYKELEEFRAQFPAGLDADTFEIR